MDNVLIVIITVIIITGNKIFSPNNTLLPQCVNGKFRIEQF